ncbi:MAG: serine/threonine transporter SstT [Coriobacteriales bacterium]|nr:serine/threonine transporter SstT [Coriobacteriales bacterium]MBQ6585365.1 serine/threonine transporter SstT [Coriobacteriales bacterium]
MKKIINKYVETNLVLRIVIGLVVGILLALIAPSWTFVAIFGTLFVGALKAIAPILVFILVCASLTNAKVGHKSNMSHVVLLYILGTACASFMAVLVSFAFPVDMVFSGTADLSDFTPPSSIGVVLTNLLGNVVSNPVASLANANYLGILFWAVILGLANRKFATASFKDGLNIASQACSTAVRWIIQFAPFGIMGLIFSAVSESGLAIFTDYGKLVLVLVTCMLLMFLVVNPLIVFLNTHKNPYPLVFRCIKDSAITAFFTRSSAANIPVNMQLCKDLGLDEDNYSISIPLGATINMEGAAITIAVMTLAAVHTLGVPVNFVTALLLSLLAAVGACGASGVAGGSLLLIPMACSLFGIGNDIAMGVVAVGFIIGVIQDSFETALNSSTDALFTATAEYYKQRKAEQAAKKAAAAGADAQ